MLTREQLELRKTGLGASELGAALGLSRWQSPVAVAVEKWDPEIVEKTSNAMTAGTWLEDAVANWAAHEYGWTLHRWSQTMRHKEHEWMLATIDRFLVDETRRREAVVEIKTTYDLAADDGWGPADTDQLPAVYRVQVAAQQAVTGLDRAYLVALGLRSRELRRYVIDRNEALEAAIIEKGGAFWRDCVLARQIPQVDGTEATARALARHFSDPNVGVRESTQEADNWAQLYLAASADEKAAKARKDEAGNFLRFHIGQDKGIQGDWGRALWSPTKGRVKESAVIAELAERAGIDAAELADLKERHRGPETRVLRVTPRKGD